MSYILRGRPDHDNPGFCWSYAKSFPAYVHGRIGSARLMHKVVAVKMQWWVPTTVQDCGDSLIRLDSPKAMIAECCCGMSFFLEAKRSRTCNMPDPKAVLCGRCHGLPPTFGKHSQQKVSAQHARDHLGCVAEGVAA